MMGKGLGGGRRYITDCNPLPSSPLTSQSSLSSSENSSSSSFKANLKLLFPPTIKNQTGCRKQEGKRKRGRIVGREGTRKEYSQPEERGEVTQSSHTTSRQYIQTQVYSTHHSPIPHPPNVSSDHLPHPTPLSSPTPPHTSNVSPTSCPHPCCQMSPLISCPAPAPPSSPHSAALITNCRLPSAVEADHLLQENANTPLNMARWTHSWSSTVRLYREGGGEGGGWGLMM